MYIVLCVILLVLGVSGVFYNYKKGNFQSKDIGVKILAISVILAMLLVATVFIK